MTSSLSAPRLASSRTRAVLRQGSGSGGRESGATTAVAPSMATTSTRSPGRRASPPVERADQVSPERLIRPPAWVTVSMTYAVRPTFPATPRVGRSVRTVKRRLTHGRTPTSRPTGHDGLDRETCPEGRSNSAGDGAASEHEEDEVDGGRFDRPEREGDPDPDQPSRVLEHRVTSLQSRSPRLAPSPYDVRRGLGVP